MSEGAKIIKVIDSHTAGEPTRVVVAGAPDNPGATPAQWREFLRNEHDWLRTAMACEPRGHEAVVGALLCEPTQPDCVAGVVFFNNVGYLHGCLHGTIGVTVTLAHLGRLKDGENKIEIPTGVVTVRPPEDGWVSVRNVRSWCHATDVPVEVPGWGTVQGDVAWGGNWFYLIEAGDMIKVDFSNLDQLTDFTCAVRKALEENGITGAENGEIDHIEVFGPPAVMRLTARILSFVPVSNMTVRPAVLAPAPSSPACTLWVNLSPDRSGGRLGFWTLFLRVLLRRRPRAVLSPRSRAAPSSRPRRR